MLRARFPISPAILLSATCLVTLFGCGKKTPPTSSDRYVLACGPSDQHGSYLSPLNARMPVKVGYDSRFTAGEKAKIRAAIAVWNDFSADTRAKRVLFEPEEISTVATASIPKNIEDCAFAVGTEGFGIMLVDDEAQWKALGAGESNPALTVRCARKQEFVTKQVILVNVNLTRSARAARKFETIIKHEVGHALGLDHSCDAGAGTANLVACSQVRVDPGYMNYFEAIMFPEICPDGLACLDRTLNSNDRERATCILGVSG